MQRPRITCLDTFSPVINSSKFGPSRRRILRLVGPSLSNWHSRRSWSLSDDEPQRENRISPKYCEGAQRLKTYNKSSEHKTSRGEALAKFPGIFKSLTSFVGGALAKFSTLRNIPSILSSPRPARFFGESEFHEVEPSQTLWKRPSASQSSKFPRVEPSKAANFSAGAIS